MSTPVVVPAIAVKLTTPPTRMKLGTVYNNNGGDDWHAREKFVDGIGNLNTAVDQLQQIVGISSDTASDVNGLIQLTQGNLSFGDWLGGMPTGNLKTEMVNGTSPLIPNTSFNISHTLGKIPNGFVVIQKSLAGDFYGTDSSWTTSQITISCDTASVGYVILILG